jgi:hypothetical protein
MLSSNPHQFYGNKKINGQIIPVTITDLGIFISLLFRTSMCEIMLLQVGV